jgi:hydroxyacylglutathione hydrolase
MLLRYFYDQILAQASYFVGCQETEEAIIIDPARDIEPYLDAADAEGMRIIAVTETHIHADFVSGARELSERTGATLYLSDNGGEDWKYQYVKDYNHVLVRDGQLFKVGNIRFEVLHTPGHTPEHISFLMTDTAGADRPTGRCGVHWPVSSNWTITCSSGPGTGPAAPAVRSWVRFPPAPWAMKSSSIGP